MTAQEILKLIEEVSAAMSVPEPTSAIVARLDEIDLCVCAYVTGWEVIDGGWIGETGKGDMQEPPKYTRSRDALKAIRPEGWNIYCDMTTIDFAMFKGWVFALHNEGRGMKQISAFLPTEELAELHAIIQAIEYERNAK